ncbi:MAG: hypothetical protein HOP12_06835 [Candidatus Eisenbacteria bacterium]|uniref:DUF2845 domain-containing protein n=1 Tax=Eiseniibacteriota bacterium TaxID=2212470 RepID=A0A849SXL1_UNCEI|nr:hypothetical protein [Candidatus Eisenbacteria bacterium]
MRSTIVTAFAVSLLLHAAPGLAELDRTVLKLGESRLKSAFEGSQVTLKLDMPATSGGVDVSVGEPQPLDLGDYSHRLKQFGVALRSGSSVMVTKVKVNPKFIEFQLAGGGYGTLFDENSPNVDVESAEKTKRERDLEGWIRGEPNAERKREMQRELDDLRKGRHREDAANRARVAGAAEMQRALIAEKRLSGGSRFNLRYPNGVPEAALTPDALRTALARWVRFGDSEMTESDSAEPAAGSDGVGSLRKGMTIAQVERMLGRPERLESSEVDGLKRTTCVYSNREGTFEVVFVEGVLVRYTVR